MIRWVWGFVDRSLVTFAESAAFWCAATGSTLSPRRGESDEFATFRPAAGDACLKLQGTVDAGGAHLDFETADLATTTARLLDLGGRVRSAAEPGLVVAESPGGIAFCLTDHHGATVVPEPVDGSRLDQV